MVGGSHWSTSPAVTSPLPGAAEQVDTSMRSRNGTPPRFLFTIDADWLPGSERGLVRLFDLADRYQLPATVFVTGRFAVDYAEILRDGLSRGVEFGTHGWEHGQDPREEFRTASAAVQRDLIERSTDALERATGVRAKIFRAPNLWIGETTIRVLDELGYSVDSSVPSRRFDLGIGQVSNPRYYWAPLEPYRPAVDDLRRRGSSRVVEVPPSAYFVPINMSALRQMGLAPLRWAIRRLASRTSVVTFYCHPTEFEVADRQRIGAGVPARYRAGIGPHQVGALAAFLDMVLGEGLIPASLSSVADGLPRP